MATGGETPAVVATTGHKRKAATISTAEHTLGKFASEYAAELKLKGWRRFVSEARGTSNINARAKHVPHNAARLLGHLEKRGASVIMTTEPWSPERRDRAVRRGSHKSSHGEIAFVSEEMVNFCRQGYWVVLPYSEVADLPHLRISPLGVVPQRDRRPRLIVDYSFSDVNTETFQLAPKEAMQFGRALQRVFTTIVHADPRYGPVYLAKIDVADGFYRVWIQIDDVPKLGVVLPTAPGCQPLVAFPLALPMGWVESPPYFTALTETACDLANAALQVCPTLSRLKQAHRLEAVANTPPPDAVPCTHAKQTGTSRSTLSTHGHPPVASVDVYVDDFLLLAQTHAQRQKVLRATLQAIDAVFRPLESSDPAHRTEPASIKKMLKGDAHWSTWKRMLGWDLDTINATLHLPAHRLDRLLHVLSWICPPRKRLSTKKWHQLLGELRSMAPALPGTRGLFSVLQEALSRGDRHRVRLNPDVYATAHDFRVLVNAVASRPTRLHELVPTPPSDIGACDACRIGMGGVWFDAIDPTAAPVLWRLRFPPHVVAALITSDNPHGSLSISDLELAGVIAHKEVLATHRDIAERTIWIASDNRAAISWSNKGSSTSLAARAHLLRYNALQQRRFRYIARHHYIPGDVNVMADDASSLLANAHPSVRDECYRDWCALQEATSMRGSAQRSANAATAWELWQTFCSSLGLDARHLPSRDPIPLLQLYAQRYRTGAIAPGRRPVRSRTVEDALRAVGQAYTGMGAPDPRLNAHGQVDFRLSAMYRAWAGADDPPSRVKPLPLQLVAHVWHHASLAATPRALAAAGCLTFGFFFLLRPGEYLGTPNRTQFVLQDVRFWIGSRAIDHLTCPAADILAATFVTLTFTRQKNGVRNETVGHGRSGHAHLCPVHSLGLRVLALRSDAATAETPLNAFRATAQAPWSYILPSDLTSSLRAGLASHPDPAYGPSDVSIRSTRAGGAMALLCAGVDSDRIRLLGRWRSDEMYRYLHVQAQPVMTGLAAAMLRGGSFRLSPN
ncbi:hypothetical protein MHU86_14576 [Fragilaria crotonensis]|nr:hypothetical protein MHU86_14576 [Fragilaria crotonensis]